MPDDICEMARLLADLGKTVFFPIHVEGNWEKFPSYDSDWVEALKLFLRFYAFERNANLEVYKDAAIDALNECRNFLNDEDATQKVWEKNKELLKNKSAGLNASHQPLNPGNSSSEKYDALIFCKNFAKFCNKNIYKFALYKIKDNKILEAHTCLQKIRDVGPKIASLFLRDVAIKNCINDADIKNRHLLQPIDVWLERITKILVDPNTKKNNAAKKLVWLADKAQCSAPFLNAGIWYFGSQVAQYFGSQVAQMELQLKSDLKDPGSFRCAIEKRREKLAGKVEVDREAKLLSDFLSRASSQTSDPPDDKATDPDSEREPNDRFTWEFDDVVWVKPGQTDQEAEEEWLRRRAEKLKGMPKRPEKS